MVQHGGLGRSRGGPVVMACDGVEELREDGRVEVAGALLEHPQAEVHVAEEPALLGRPERRATAELADAPDVVQERGGQQEVVTQPGMQLRGLAAERRDSDGVLEQAAGVAVVPVCPGRRKRAECLPDLRVADERAHDLGEPVVRDLRCEELEEAVELVGVATQCGRELGRVRVLRRLHCTYLHLELSAEALHATENVHGVSLAEAPVEQVDVVPDPRLDASARVCELEREVRGSGSSASTLLLRHREHTLDGPVLGEVRDRGHGPSLFLETVGTLAAMADVQPFRAVRYSGAAGALADLVAPPYDAVDDEERARLYTRSPYNVLHADASRVRGAGRVLYREWLASGILEPDDEPATWVSVESYVGPDGIARERQGTIVSLPAEPYETGAVLPHERTHELIREERLRLLRATHVQPEPILLLADGVVEVEVPSRPPDVEVDGTRLWRSRLRRPSTRDSCSSPTATIGTRARSTRARSGRRAGANHGARRLDRGCRTPGSSRLTASSAVGPDLAGPGEGEPCRLLARRFVARWGEPRDRSARRVPARSDRARPRRGRGELDTELVDRHGLDGIGYTPRLDEAIAARRPGRRRRRPSCCASRRVDDVFATARARQAMPQKSTYFFPKPLSGLLFHPVDVTPWLDVCRLCVADIRGVLVRLPTRVEREPVARRGEGGDDTTAIDQAAEDAVVERLAALGRDFVLVSEELGERTFGAGGRDTSSSTRSTAR